MESMRISILGNDAPIWVKRASISSIARDVALERFAGVGLAKALHQFFGFALQTAPCTTSATEL